MNGLRETLTKLELLCWQSTTEKEAEDKIQEYLKNYPHLRNPACIDLLRQAVKTWQKIQYLEGLWEKTEDEKQKTKMSDKIEKLTRTWIQMIANLGLSFTKQQFISKKAPLVNPPEEMFKMLKRKEKDK